LSAKSVIGVTEIIGLGPVSISNATMSFLLQKEDFPDEIEKQKKKNLKKSNLEKFYWENSLSILSDRIVIGEQETTNTDLDNQIENGGEKTESDDEEIIQDAPSTTQVLCV
jgi:hypothetical protein